MKNLLGYAVHEIAPDYPIEQCLVLRTGPTLPPGGILDWPRQPSEARSVFPDRKSAGEAITRTNHYRLAFAAGMHPDKQFCRIVPVKSI